jgi:hypothetical protein
MKKKIHYSIILCLFFGLLSCENSETTNNFENQKNNIDDTIRAIKEDAENNVDFEIVKVTKSEFDDKGTFEFHFELKNKTLNKFSRAFLSAEMQYVLQDGQTCNSIFQQGPNPDIHPLPAENWLPNSVIEYKIISPDHRNVAGCNSMSLDRTPKSLDLILTLSAISVDQEVKNKEIVVYDLLPIWKEKQKSLGLR